jgi:hypothetical protein
MQRRAEVVETTGDSMPSAEQQPLLENKGSLSRPPLSGRRAALAAGIRSPEAEPTCWFCPVSAAEKPLTNPVGTVSDGSAGLGSKLSLAVLPGRALQLTPSSEVVRLPALTGGRVPKRGCRLLLPELACREPVCPATETGRLHSARNVSLVIQQ